MGLRIVNAVEGGQGWIDNVLQPYVAELSPGVPSLVSDLSRWMATLHLICAKQDMLPGALCRIVPAAC